MTPWPTFVRRRRSPRRGCPVPIRYPRTCSRSVRWRPCRPGLLHDRPAVLSVGSGRRATACPARRSAWRGPAGDQQRGPDRDGGCRPADHVDGSQREAPCGEAAGEAGASVQERPQESQGDSHRHSPASVSDRSVLTLRLSRRLVLPVWTETCTEIRTNAAADAGGHPRLSKTPRSGLNRDRTHRGQKMAPLQRKSMASLSARSKE